MKFSSCPELIKERIMELVTTGCKFISTFNVSDQDHGGDQGKHPTTLQADK